MREGHYHLHVSPVSRGKGKSAVEAAAYQANQRLTQHEKKLTDDPQKLGWVDATHTEMLNRGVITDALRQQCEKLGIALHKHAHAIAHDGYWMIQNKHHTYTLREQKKAKGGIALAIWTEGKHLDISHRKALNKGNITEELRNELKAFGIQLSPEATGGKGHKRRYWIIEDGDNIYTLREHKERRVNPHTGKQIYTGRKSLDIWGSATYDYTDKGDVQDTWFQTPDSAPKWMKDMAYTKNATAEDRELLWNHVEKIEIARDSRPVRWMNIALPRELSKEQHEVMLRRFVKEELTDKGLITDVAIHQVDSSDGHPLGNRHAHILFTTRPLDENGKFVEIKDAAKARSHWNSKQRVYDWREAWANIVNDAFADNNDDTRIYHESYKKRGMTQRPGIHMGDAAWNKDKRRESTRRGRENRSIGHANDMRRRASAARRRMPLFAPRGKKPQEVNTVYGWHLHGQQQERFNEAALEPPPMNPLKIMTANAAHATPGNDNQPEREEPPLEYEEEDVFSRNADPWAAKMQKEREERDHNHER